MKLANLPWLSKWRVTQALAEARPKEPASRSYRYMARLLDQEYGQRENGVCLAYFSPDDDRITADALLMLGYCLQSELNSKVLLVDARVRNIEAGLSGRLHLTQRPGYAELLRDGCEASRELVLPTAVPLVDVISAGTIAQDSPTQVAQDNLRSLIAHYRQHYQYVLLQVGSLLADTRNLQVAAQADAVFMIAQENHTMLNQFDDSQRLLERNGIGHLRMIVSTAAA